MYSFVSTVVLFRTWERKTTYLVTISIANRVAVKNYRPTLHCSTVYVMVFMKFRWGSWKVTEYNFVNIANVVRHSSYDFWKQCYMILDSLGSINHIDLWIQSMITCSHEATASHRLNSNDRPSTLWVIGSLCKKLVHNKSYKKWSYTLVTRGVRQSTIFAGQTCSRVSKAYKMLGKHRTKCTLQADP